MIMKCESFAKALAVLEILQADEQIMFDHVHRWLTGAYQNGREQGVLVWGGGKDLSNPAYYIAVYRRSDQIVIYKGKYEMQSLSDDAYKHPKFFSCVDDAADWLRQEILDTK